mmetsp:Transcript_87632/g.246141  ORF Transcript_87632/g.246141 Transcript_87632/m.246141 type:complete len:233 (+) Transcript_87632:520-1218(+)
MPPLREARPGARWRRDSGRPPARHPGGTRGGVSPLAEADVRALVIGSHLRAARLAERPGELGGGSLRDDVLGAIVGLASLGLVVLVGLVRDIHALRAHAVLLVAGGARRLPFRFLLLLLLLFLLLGRIAVSGRHVALHPRLEGHRVSRQRVHEGRRRTRLVWHRVHGVHGHVPQGLLDELNELLLHRLHRGRLRRPKLLPAGFRHRRSPAVWREEVRQGTPELVQQLLPLGE